MKPVPTDPWALQARIMAALCDDIFDATAKRDSSFSRLEALRSSMIATRSGQDIAPLSEEGVRP